MQTQSPAALFDAADAAAQQRFPEPFQRVVIIGDGTVHGTNILLELGAGQLRELRGVQRMEVHDQLGGRKLVSLVLQVSAETDLPVGAVIDARQAAATTFDGLIAEAEAFDAPVWAISLLRKLRDKPRDREYTTAEFEEFRAHWNACLATSMPGRRAPVL